MLSVFILSALRLIDEESQCPIVYPYRQASLVLFEQGLALIFFGDTANEF